LASLYQVTGRYAEAEPLYQRAIGITEKTLGPDHPDLAIKLDNLAALYRATGRYAEAEPLLRRAVAILEKRLPPDHPDLMISLENYASLLDHLIRDVQAVELRAWAEVIRQQRGLSPPPPSP
jgi:tetratricopeptide (TPR) repeat protein